MGFCPFLSLRKIIQVNVAPRTIGGSITRDNGSTVTSWIPGTEEAVYKPTSISAAIDTVDYNSAITYEPCQTTACQLWDDKNSRCGARSSDFIYNGNTVESDAIVNIIKAVVGSYSQITSGNTLVQEFQDVVGKSTEQDNSSSLYKYLQDVIGTHAEKDGINNSTSLINYLQDVVGKNADKDNDKSLLSFLSSILGANTDKDSGNSFLKQFTEIVGSITDKDVASADWGILTSLLSTFRLTHVPSGEAPAPSTLIMEFLNKTDADKVDFSSLGVSGSIYGHEFMIYESNPDDLPPILKTIQEHPDFKTDDIVDLANSNCSVTNTVPGHDSTDEWEYTIEATDGTTDFVVDGITTDMYVFVESINKVGTITEVAPDSVATKLKINMGVYDIDPLPNLSYFFIAGRKRISFAEYESMF